ncbi:hypothetical protein PINS_up020815 [Pythium insidiosum]|nr:hypothetical protein PINS_up020815 [Pythium insidiosum]
MNYLMRTLESVLQCSLKTVQELGSSISVDRAVIDDVEVFLSVPLQLLTGACTEGRNINIKQHVNELMEHVEEGQMRNVSIFSSQRDVDFSQFTPRGHYTKSLAHSMYFRAMTWLGTIDIRIWSSQSPEDPDAHLRALQRAIALTWVLREAEQLKEVNGMMKLITSLVGGGSDSMTPGQLAELLPDRNEGIQLLLRDLRDSRQSLEALFATIKDRNLGAQQIAGHPLYTEDLQSNGELPISFAMLGQQFTLGSLVLSNVVFDNVKLKGESVNRRVPSVSLDVGFALFGNDAAVPEIARRMGRDTSQATIVERLRDGLPYASNLVALRRTVDRVYAQSQKLEQSIGDQWVGMLRHLSAKCPVASPTFHSEAWKLRQLTTQVASFTQLRHDTLLYAKQSNTVTFLCEYPAGYVEPYPDFWKAFERMVSSLEPLIPLHDVKDFLVTFGKTLETLREISEYQRDGKQLTSKQKEFLRDVIEVHMGSGTPSYRGWYPGLFFKAREQAVEADYLVADVHTDTPSLTSPGHVVHLGVGQVFSGVFVVDDVMYTGPVFSSYEVVTPFPMRLTDEEFGKNLPEYSCETWAKASHVC